MRMNRIDCSNYYPKYLYNYHNHSNKGNAHAAVKKHDIENNDICPDISDITEKDEPKCKQETFENAPSTANKTNISTPDDMSPFTALERLLSISANVDKRKQKGH